MSLSLHLWLHYLVFQSSLLQLSSNQAQDNPLSMHLSESTDVVYNAWLASRVAPGRKGLRLTPGAQRSMSIVNLKLAGKIAKVAAPKIFKQVWGLHPARAVLLVSLNIARGVFPALRGYSQALIINELQTSLSAGHFTWPHLARLLCTEMSRMVLESAVDSLTNSNEKQVYGSARLLVEYRQMEQQLRLDVPTLSDPVVRELLHESDLFVRSFAQAGVGGFGLLSPLDFVRIITLVAELASHIFVLYSLVHGSRSHCLILILSILSILLPHAVAWCGLCSRPDTQDLYSPQQAEATENLEKMRNLAYSDPHRPEIISWGLSSWILRSWVNARRTMLGLERSDFLTELNLSSSLLAQLHFDFADTLILLQNIPVVLMLQTSAGSLGSLALYRNSFQALVFTVRQLLSTTRMLLQSVFLMGAFSAAMDIQPRLMPRDDKRVSYQSLPRGMKIEARNLSYTYPGSKQPALSGVNFTLEAGERLAIVGHNGSGKSTLAKILVRIFDFDSGELLVNGVDIRNYNPDEYHTHLSTVFQGFSKFNATVTENVGIGYIEHLHSRCEIERAVNMAGASHIVDSLPRGLKTKLDTAGSDPSSSYPPPPGMKSNQSLSYHHGLSGGEWQHIALSRAFMRADRPDVDMLVFDEPTSSLDAHAQNRTFDTVEKISRDASGERTKTVIFITHRLSTARRADKIAFIENGTISEYGTHAELLSRQGAYAALYHASI